MTKRRTRSLIAATLALAAGAALVMASPGGAALAVGRQAPLFHTKGALGGKTIDVDLRRALKAGPVVLYFYPKAFTSGCTLEAKAFSDAMPAFRAAGASVIGLSVDKLSTLKRFSTEACRGQFPVAVADKALVKAYDVAMPLVGKVRPMSNRTSFVIAPDGRIVLVHSDNGWKDHVPRTLAAVQALNAKR